MRETIRVKEQATSSWPVRSMRPSLPAASGLAAALALLVIASSCVSQPPTAPMAPGEALAVIYDDDGSPDGSAALFYLLSHPAVSVSAIGISYGESTPAVYVQYLGRKLDELGIPSIPLGAGQASPLAGSNGFPAGLRQAGDRFWDWPVDETGKTYLPQAAAELIVATARQAPRPITVFVSGPSTNLAGALRLDPSIVPQIEAVWIMGGAVEVPGNIRGLLPTSDNQVAEWNVYADPQAAREVLESGLDIYLVPLDAADQVTLIPREIDPWRQGGPAARFAAAIYDSIFDGWGVRNAPTWDLMTAAIMTDPDLCGFESLHLEVVTAVGPTSGQTVQIAGAEPNVHACMDPQVDRIKQRLSQVFSESR